MKVHSEYLHCFGGSFFLLELTNHSHIPLKVNEVSAKKVILPILNKKDTWN